MYSLPKSFQSTGKNYHLFENVLVLDKWMKSLSVNITMSNKQQSKSYRDCKFPFNIGMEEIENIKMEYKVQIGNNSIKASSELNYKYQPHIESIDFNIFGLYAAENLFHKKDFDITCVFTITNLDKNLQIGILMRELNVQYVDEDEEHADDAMNDNQADIYEEEVSKMEEVLSENVSKNEIM